MRVRVFGVLTRADDGGEEYMLLSDVAKFHKEKVSTIIAEFPGLHRRQATYWERGVLHR